MGFNALEFRSQFRPTLILAGQPMGSAMVGEQMKQLKRNAWVREVSKRGMQVLSLTEVAILKVVILE